MNYKKLISVLPITILIVVYYIQVSLDFGFNIFEWNILYQIFLFIAIFSSVGIMVMVYKYYLK